VSAVSVELGRSFTFNGHRLVYDLYGPSEAPLVVYLHPLLLDSELNRGIAQALGARGFRIALLDLLGHGRSDKPTHASEYRIDSYADQVVGLLDDLGAARAVLGGISLGANVSLFAASRYPDRTRALVLEMPVLERAVPTAALVFAPMIIATRYGRSVMRVTSGLASRVPRSRSWQFNAVINAASMPPDSAAAVLHGVLVGPVAPTDEQRRAIEAPTFVLAHRNDLIHPFDDAVALVDRLPNGVLVRAQSPLELRLRPDRLTGELVRFLSDLEPLTRARRRRSRAAKAPTGPAEPETGPAAEDASSRSEGA
jgi:pimeloyl-ACP methyl ester carboxylesterase